MIKHFRVLLEEILLIYY